MEASRAALASRVKKTSVDYSRGMADRRCGLCTYFQKPDGCEKVAGRIDPEYWCRLFKAK
jgi:hypothetical protein